MSVETVRQLKKRGIFTASPRGQMDLEEARVAYIRNLREQAAGRSSQHAEDHGLDLVTERARLAAAQADRTEMQNAERRRELVPIGAVTLATVSLIELTKGRLLRIPAAVATKNAKLKAQLEDAIVQALEDLSLTRVQERTGRPDDVTAEDEEDAA